MTDLLAEIERLTAERDQARAERDATVEGCRRYGVHLANCDMHYREVGFAGRCTCGLTELIANPATAARTRRMAALEELYAALTAAGNAPRLGIFWASQQRVQTALAAVRETDSGEREPTK